MNHHDTHEDSGGPLEGFFRDDSGSNFFWAVLFALTCAIVFGLLFSGCTATGTPQVFDDVSIVEPVSEPVKPVLPVECRPETIKPPVSVQKAGKDQTPATATEKAFVINAARLRDASIAHRRCYCFMIAAGLAIGVDQKAFDEICKKPLESTGATAKAKKPAAKKEAPAS